MKTLGVLILCPFFSPNVGGVETHLDDLCGYLGRQGHRVVVITYQPLTTRAAAPRFEDRGNVVIYRLPWFGHNWFHKLEPYPLLEFLYLTPGLFFGSLRYLLRHGREIDVIHAHGLSAALITKFLCKAFRKRGVASTHAFYDLTRRPSLSKLVRWVLSSFDKVLTLSRQSKAELVSIGLPEEKVEVYTYWVDQEVFRPLDRKQCRNELRWGSGFNVLFVGRLIGIKGVSLLLEVARREENRDVRFAFVGDGPMAQTVQNAAQELPNVSFVGRVENHRLNLYYNAADLLVMPSQYEEGYGRVILEALSCGTPVIASNRGGIAEALDPSVGILVEPTADAISGALRSFRSDQSKLETMRARCLEYAQRLFSERNAALIEASYYPARGVDIPEKIRL